MTPVTQIHQVMKMERRKKNFHFRGKNFTICCDYTNIRNCIKVNTAKTKR